MAQGSISQGVYARGARHVLSFRRLLVLGVILLLAATGLAYWWAGQWTPSRDRYPVQGVALSAGNGPVEWPTLRAEGVEFAYLAATAGDAARDRSFAANWAGAKAAGLRYGAIHAFSLCRPASDQARLFMAIVPRDNAALPPVVSLGFDAACAARPSRDVVLAELNTLLNEIEAHSGKPAVLRIAAPFEERYEVSEGINRTIWLNGNLFAPDYAAHPWVLWTANDRRSLPGVEAPVEWTVVKR